MSHKTLVNGTAYEVKGGKCLVNGTVYSIKKGRTLIGGTGYDITFGPKKYTINLTLTKETNKELSNSLRYVYIGSKSGERHSPEDIFDIEDGIKLVVEAGSFYSSGKGRCKIFLDGKSVAQGGSKRNAEYTFTPASNCTIEFVHKYLPSADAVYAEAYITTNQ